MKVAYLITKAEHGGAQVHVRDLIAGLTNVDPILAVGDDGFLVEEARKLGVPVRIIPSLDNSINPAKDFRAVRETIRFLSEGHPDLVHVHSTKAGIVGRVAARLVRTPCVFTAHGWAFADGVSRKRKVLAVATEKLMAPLARQIITVSDADRALAMRYRVGTTGQLQTIHNGVPDVPQRASYRESNEITVVMVARFAPPKDHIAAVRAISRLDIPCRLRFIGDGPTLPAVKAEAEAAGVTKRIEFMGSRNDIPHILAQSDIFVLASDWEGLPLSVLEGMRAGLPVVASNVGGVSEAVDDGKTGFLVPRGDIDAISERIRRLAINYELRQAMGTAGRQRYEQYFSFKGMLDKTFAVYEAALEAS